LPHPVCADDQILMATSEDELQTMAYHLKLIQEIQNVHIQHKNRSNDNVGEPNTEGKICDK
jgi:hypothetical protein